MKTRTSVIKNVSVAGASLLLTLTSATNQALASAQVAQTQLPGTSIPKYVTPLPTFVGARVDGTKPLIVSMEEIQQQVLPPGTPGAPGPTTLWAYKVQELSLTPGVAPKVYGPLWPAFTIEAKQGVPTHVQYVNNLQQPNGAPPVLQQYLTVDQTIHWADPLNQMASMPMTPYTGPVPAVVHLHGAEVPSAFDGGPDQWFTPDKALLGKGFVSDFYTYPNGQEATTLFYHDHALGATRVNLYAGLAGIYFLRDARDTGLTNNPIGLPAGPQEIELAIQDRSFDTQGQLLFPDQGINMEHPYWLPEFFGDVICVNGAPWPYLNVEPRCYRFRIVNGSNARFYRMSLVSQTRGNRTLPGPAIWQIGTDGGLLDTPVMLNRGGGRARSSQLLLGPGERADVIIDFNGFDGKNLVLLNDAPAPFPLGIAPDPATEGQVMQFRVGATLSSQDRTYKPAIDKPLRTPMVRLTKAVTAATPHRQLTLNEDMGMGGPLRVLVNNSQWHAAVTETPRVGATEVWEIINLTADAHPIHLHLVQFQLINRQAIDQAGYQAAYDALFPGGAFIGAFGPPLPYNTPNAAGAIGGNPDVTPFLLGTATRPNPNENGWKDTVVMYPGEVTRIVVRWAPQSVAAGAVAPGTNLYPFDPTAAQGTTDAFGYPGGPGYVWHCHIVDHEDNEMMRPQVIAP